MSILKALSVPAFYVLRLMSEAAKKADIPGMINRSFTFPIWVRYGVGCEQEFVEYCVFRAVNSVSACAGKSAALRRKRL